MSLRNREEWSRHINQVIRSQHYTWLAEGLGGQPVPFALSQIMTDVMHICAREGIRFDSLLARSRAQFEQEECEVSQPMSATR